MTAAHAPSETSIARVTVRNVATLSVKSLETLTSEAHTAEEYEPLQTEQAGCATEDCSMTSPQHPHRVADRWQPNKTANRRHDLLLDKPNETEN